METDIQDVKLDVRSVKRQDAGGLPPRNRASDYLLAGGASNAGPTEAHVCLPSGAKVPPKIITHARQGEYINLADFAPCLEPSLVTETSIVDGELVFKPKRNVKSIDFFLLWSMSWRSYEELLIQHDPSLYTGFCAYRIFIQTCAAKYWWPAVYFYDVRNRSNHAMHHSFQFDHIDQDIYVTTMDSTTVRQNIKNCSRCKSIWHVVKDCPFQEDSPVASGPRQPSQHTRPQANATRLERQNISNQICYNWNAGRCTANPCQRRHVCESCGGPDPRPRCIPCNLGPQNRRVTANSPGRTNFTQPSFAQPPPPSNSSSASGRVG
jgi:hypothetical protein